MNPFSCCVTVSLLPALTAVLWCAACAGQEPTPAASPAGETGWLNAGDCGASGSEFGTTAATTAGSKVVIVADVGDFRAGQGVMLSESNPRLVKSVIWGPRAIITWEKPLEGKAELRGYDGTQGDWVVLFLDVPKGSKTFRWSEDFARSWKPTVPMTGEWQPLRDGLEVRFNPHDWEKGYTVVFAGRGQLETVIEKIAGNAITLRDAPTRTAEAATLRHSDDVALQAAIDRGIREKKNVHIPAGRYRLSRGVTVKDAAGITIEGVSATDTVLDISEGEGACVTLSAGTEVTLRNLTMTGHSGYKERDQCGSIPVLGARYFWGFAAKCCNAVTIRDTERVLLENCHGTRMSMECFYSGGRSRTGGKPEPKQYTKAITFLRCSVVDNARNAFNNNDMAENTSILNCRIVDTGGCTWEGASRFVKFIGNYVRNSGTVAMGNIGSRAAHYEELGSAQHIVADNVFESGVCYGGCAIRSAHGACQVIIRNNLFINFNSSAVEAWGVGDARHLPAANTIVSGNIFDMTCITDQPAARHAVSVSTMDTVVSDNQIYVRGACDPRVTGIKLSEPMLNLSVHGNLIRNCGSGIAATRARSRVTEVIDSRTFVATGQVSLERRRSHRYQGWNLVWMLGSSAAGQTTIEAFDAETLRFQLTAPAEIKVGASFEVYPPLGPNWNIHNNVISDCLAPVVLDVYGGAAAVLRDNLVSRGSAVGVKQAVAVHGAFRLIGNQFSGFDEIESAVLTLYPDRFGKPCRSVYRDNFFTQCAVAVSESQPGLWDAASVSGNTVVGGTAPPNVTVVAAQAPITVQPLTVSPKPVLRAPALPAPVVVDGDVREWPWTDKTRAVVLEQSTLGDVLPTAPKSCAVAAVDTTHFYLAVRVTTSAGYKLQPATSPYSGDGMEVAFQSAEPQVLTPIFMCYGSANGSFWPHAAGGATAEQMALLEKETQYAVKEGQGEWTAEWRIPLAVLGKNSDAVRKLRFNIGVFHKSADLWVVWCGTGAEIYRVENAGEVIMAE